MEKIFVLAFPKNEKEIVVIETIELSEADDDAQDFESFDEYVKQVANDAVDEHEQSFTKAIALTEVEIRRLWCKLDIFMSDEIRRK